MSVSEASYEIMRDNQKMPVCWQVRNDRCAPHFHSSLELVYMLGGQLQVTLNGQAYTVEKGELAIVPSYTFHTYATPKASESLIMLIPLDYIAGFHKIAKGRSFCRTVLPSGKPVQQLSAEMKAVQKLTQQAGDGMPKEDFLLRGHVYILLGLLLQAVPMEKLPRESDHHMLQGVLTYLHENQQKELTLEGIARTFGYSSSRFSSIFNRNVGCSLPEYLNNLRARSTAQLLLENDISVTDAALQAGFESTRTFYRAFKAHYGMTASEYLLANRQK